MRSGCFSFARRVGFLHGFFVVSPPSHDVFFGSASFQLRRRHDATALGQHRTCGGRDLVQGWFPQRHGKHQRRQHQQGLGGAPHFRHHAHHALLHAFQLRFRPRFADPSVGRRFFRSGRRRGASSLLCVSEEVLFPFQCVFQCFSRRILPRVRWIRQLRSFHRQQACVRFVPSFLRYFVWVGFDPFSTYLCLFVRHRVCFVVDHSRCSRWFVLLSVRHFHRYQSWRVRFQVAWIGSCSFRSTSSFSLRSSSPIATDGCWSSPSTHVWSTRAPPSSPCHTCHTQIQVPLPALPPPRPCEFLLSHPMDERQTQHTPRERRTQRRESTGRGY